MLVFGQKVKVGNYQILKYTKSLSKQELKRLRDIEGVPMEIRQHLDRAKLPYIKVSTVSGSWAVEFVIGTTMYEAIDALTVVRDAAGNRMLMGTEATNAEAIFVAMLADTTTVGDYEYQVEKQKLLSAYLDRASKELNEKEDSGKSDEERKAEEEEALQDAAEVEQFAETLRNMGEELKKEEEK